MRAGYDHSYYFIQTFMADHLAWHAAALQKLVRITRRRRSYDAAVPSRAVSSRNASRSVAVVGPGLAGADDASVDARDRRQLAHRARAEHLVRAIDLGQRQVAVLAARSRASHTARARPSA